MAASDYTMAASDYTIAAPDYTIAASKVARAVVRPLRDRQEPPVCGGDAEREATDDYPQGVTSVRPSRAPPLQHSSATHEAEACHCNRAVPDQQNPATAPEPFRRRGLRV